MPAPDGSWARVPVAAAQDPNLTRADLRVLMVLCQYADADGVCWPRAKTIGAALDMKRQSVSRCLQRLKMRGWIMARPRYRPALGGQTSNEYAVQYPKPEIALQDDESAFSDGETSGCCTALEESPTGTVKPSGVAPGETSEGCGGCNAQRFHHEEPIEQPIEQPSLERGLGKTDTSKRPKVGLHSRNEAHARLMSFITTEAPFAFETLTESEMEVMLKAEALKKGAGIQSFGHWLREHPDAAEVST